MFKIALKHFIMPEQDVNDDQDTIKQQFNTNLKHQQQKNNIKKGKKI